MKAGRRRIPLTLQGPSTTRDAFGQVIETFADVASPTVWVSLENTTSEQDDGTDAVRPRDRYRATTAYRADIDYRNRLVWGTRVFEIEGLNNVQERNRDLEIDLVEMGE